MPYYSEDGTTIFCSYINRPDSSFVRMLAYDEVTGELYVQLNEMVYVYSGVLEEVYHDFVGARSVGSFYDTNVRGHYASQHVGDQDDYQFSVRPVLPAPEPEVAQEVPSLALTDPGLDKSWFDLSYTVTQRRTDTVIARNLEDAIRILREDLENEGVENFVITSATPSN